MDVRRIAQEMRPVVYQAGYIAMSHFRHVKAERKADESYVTDADRDVENFLREEIQRRYPDHGFFGEESGRHQMEQPEYVWAIDPIDGTAPFVFDLPIWAVSVGLLRKDRAAVGFVYLPVLDEMYWAFDGGAAFVNNREIRVCEPVEMTKKTTIMAPSAALNGLSTTYQGRSLSFGSAAAHLCYVARGKIHGGVIESIRLYDIAAAALILKQADGVMRYLSGKEVDLWELIDGRQIAEPFVFGHPHNAEQLRSMFVRKTKD